MPSRKPDAPLDVVILAAGQGKRMRSVLPKVLQPLAGRPLLAHVIEAAQALDPAAIHVVYGHGGEAVRERFGHAPVQWVLQTPQLGTGHALREAMPGIADDHRVLVLYGDVPLIRPATLKALVAAAGPKRVALLTVQLAQPEGYGRIVRGRSGQVQRIVEHRDANRRELALHEANTGVFAAPARLLRGWLARLRRDNAQGEYYLTDIFAMAARARVPVVPQTVAEETEVLGVNEREQLAQVEAAYRRRRALELMQAGAILIDPARIDVRGEVSVGIDVQIAANVVLEGPVQLGDGVCIGPNCVISDARLGAGTIVASHSVIQGADVGMNCRIGPFARLRPGTQLEREVHVGDFVEIKNSRLGAGTKANHLSYIGDAQLGAGVNVGAGTVTCNYDGANKSQTLIGDGAFIGSGSMLVAPVQIGADANIGAGSTITHDAPAERLTLARSRQVTIEHWRRPRRKQDK